MEVFNEYFHNIREQDMVFNFYKVYRVMDERFLINKISKTSQRKELKQLLMLQSLD
ncbi:AP-2 complex subunit sigma [Sciurus carolinensis]|uniref:AP-2 complex subunit sigma n=1 Tax=Sciurus carolinensis TaxID=30640 RepID=A0AA41MPR6_SCICA|nr:AP-2 complex subunit sigma [Sciurus carolinensis]